MLLVKNIKDFEQALEFINGNETLAFDTETTGLNPRKDQIIGFGVSNGLDGFYVPVRSYTRDNGIVCDELLAELSLVLLRALLTKKIITWNASFDIRFTKYQFGVDLLPALHADVLLMKHTCDESYPFGLKEVATKLWGHDVKKEKEEMQESIKANGGTPTQYYKGDSEKIAKYCVQDCLLTYKLFLFYSGVLRREGLENFYYRDEVLPLYKEVTIPMEEAGVRVDVQGLVQALADINDDISNVEEAIQEAIQPKLSLFVSWFLNKDYPVKTYTGKQSGWTKKHDSQFSAWRADNPFGYMFNLLSKHHLKKLFFEILKEKPVSKTEKGNPQVNEEFLIEMADKYDWAAKLIDYNKLVKLRGTYITRLLEESEDGIFYPSFMQHRTVSGRYSGDLQQLPRPVEERYPDDRVAYYTNRIREFILPHANHNLISADYEQLEPTIFAHVSGDPALQDIFHKGLDFYSEIAIRTEKLTGVSSEKNADNFLGKLDKEARQKAKSYSLGIPYGMTPYKLKFEINCSKEQATQLVEDYLNAFPKLQYWMNESRFNARLHKRVVSQMGRVRRMPETVQQVMEDFSPKLAGANVWKSDKPTFQGESKKQFGLFKQFMNNAINFQIQSLAASIVNRAAVRIARKIKARGLDAKLVMQVHDELVASCCEEDVVSVWDIMKTEMENVAKLSVPLKTTPQVGNNFRECK